MTDELYTGGQFAFPYDVRVEPDSSGRNSDVELISEDSGGWIKEPFDPEKIDVVTRTPTVSLLLSRIRRGSIDLAPDFQRHAGIWNSVNQSRLIESLLLRIPLPTFYAAETDDERWAIVDGIQRLTTICRFVDPEAVGLGALKLSGLDYLDKLNGYTFQDLPGRLKTRLEETEVVLHLIRRGTPEEVKFNIFARINTGGVPLSQQELRHALIPGKARGLLGELAESKSFIDATLGSVATGRMADREMVLRFIAFHRANLLEYKSQEFDRFLRESMSEVNEASDDEIGSVEADFHKAMTAAHDIFGKHAFRKQREGQSGRYPINKALFETVAVNLASRTPFQLDELRRRRSEVNVAMIGLFADNKFETAISVGTGDVAKIRLRFAAVDELFGRYDGSR
ncbi:DUF262 domain-containing protein [Amycolatopsis sp. NPDC058340]|uniref:DUF262 domain-containing protein n=1 Tax=Amycolatopsis sp. NPDC058340 TaxID=3346453 RepID=UPI003655A7E7